MVVFPFEKSKAGSLFKFSTLLSEQRTTGREKNKPVVLLHITRSTIREVVQGSKYSGSA